MGNEGRARIKVTLEVEVDITWYENAQVLEEAAVELIRDAINPLSCVRGLSFRSLHHIRAHLLDGPNFNTPSPVDS